MRSSSSMDHTITHCHNVTVAAMPTGHAHGATSITPCPMGHVELDLKSPFVRLINQSHRMSNNPCKLSIRRLRCYRPVHSRAVDKLIPSHGQSSEAIASVPKDQVTMARDPQSANKQPFYCPRGSHRSNSVRFLTTEQFLRRS